MKLTPTEFLKAMQGEGSPEQLSEIALQLNDPASDLRNWLAGLSAWARKLPRVKRPMHWEEFHRIAATHATEGNANSAAASEKPGTNQKLRPNVPSGDCQIAASTLDDILARRIKLLQEDLGDPASQVRADLRSMVKERQPSSGDRPEDSGTSASPALKLAMEALPPRLQQVFDLMLRRLSRGQIAAMLGISPRTVSRHVTEICSRLSADDQIALQQQCGCDGDLSTWLLAD
ncbi:MAG TPA: sigma factor-like helix-turn-helix DNA-binding protein [Phycisphaerae bacterium]|nr:sigma factor-like helix-turn-helix DNA-binding protein [Phycisphaerae bacterium]